ncbi:hypothetical protein GOARA_006_00090 [Gordonia araii NBRC 100433]|uniref:Uncharacterized protein n=1 Tax=Gordonia araii NBRC 100433 TaxID=1073574 RepID=G7GXC5_9ACTN|nr:hypothetical protein [Gordonia araii]NNG95962.1 hypothetical protein [Gordonia araii NBRC 100433]GAB08250.1 hypothetical protein GOARA_006_00090 [Gordonia araii NBRC 100433]
MVYSSHDPPRHHRGTREDERQALKIMSRKQGGRIAFAAARLADRLHRVPVAQEPVLGELLATMDLVGEVTYLVDAAKALAEYDRLLGPPPVGASARDLDVVGTYIEKARALDDRIDALLARLEALDCHRELVLGIQRQTDRDRWLEGVEAIGDLDSRSQGVADEMYAQSIRDATFETRARATVGLPHQGRSRRDSPSPRFKGNQGECASESTCVSEGQSL